MVRVLEGSVVVEVEAVEFTRRLAGRHVVLDVGTGDGRWPYEMAKRDAINLYVGIDPDASALAEYAYRASRKPSRGGVANVLYVVASVEQMPPELAGLADFVVVNFPWGGLLRGILRPEPDLLRALALPLRSGGELRVTLTYDPGHDHGATPDSGPLPSPSEYYIRESLGPVYAATGLEIVETQLLTREEALAIPSTWGRRLLHGRQREVYAFTARRQP